MFSDERTKSTWKVVDTKAFDSGVVVSTYHPAEEPAPAAGDDI